MYYFLWDTQLFFTGNLQSGLDFKWEDRFFCRNFQRFLNKSTDGGRYTGFWSSTSGNIRPESNRAGTRRYGLDVFNFSPARIKTRIPGSFLLDKDG